LGEAHYKLTVKETTNVYLGSAIRGS